MYKKKQPFPAKPPDNRIRKSNPQRNKTFRSTVNARLRSVPRSERLSHLWQGDMCARRACEGDRWPHRTLMSVGVHSRWKLGPAPVTIK